MYQLANNPTGMPNSKVRVRALEKAIVVEAEAVLPSEVLLATAFSGLMGEEPPGMSNSSSVFCSRYWQTKFFKRSLSCSCIDLPIRDSLERSRDTFKKSCSAAILPLWKCVRKSEEQVTVQGHNLQTKRDLVIWQSQIPW